MNQTRTFLLFAWLLVAFLLFMEWSKTGTSAAPVTKETTSIQSPTTQNLASDLPTAPSVTGTNAALPTIANSDGLSAQIAQTISIQTDLFKLQIDPRGVSLVSTELLKYPVEKKTGSPNVVLQDTKDVDFFVAQSGLVAAAGTKKTAPTHESLFAVENGQTTFRLADGQNTLEIPFVWQDSAQGIKVRKILILTRGSYAVKVKQEISNTGSSAWQGAAYEQFIRAQPPAPPKHSMFTNPESFSLVGAAWYTEQDKFGKKKFTNFTADDQPIKDASNSWISMVQHHFVSAWIPNANEKQQITTATLQNDGKIRYLIRSQGPLVELQPGKMRSLESTLWVGPKLQKDLEKINPSLKKTLDYGYVTVISEPLFLLLSLLHSWIGNWGWAIISIVVLLKLALYKLSAAQYKSMAKMRAIQPRLEALKERYGDDRQAYSTAMMDLYKKEKINPAGGCLPMLIPLPIFFALYWVLLESVELRQAPWMGWIQNLTAPDPYFILPAMNLIVMFVTQRLTPMPGMDPMQKKVMQFMPLMFGVLMAFFPAGLVLYWVTNGILGIAQQQIINRRHGDKPATAVIAK
ncbi:MAG: membrane protein insertase YidC [Arenimonas sp.]